MPSSASETLTSPPASIAGHPLIATRPTDDATTCSRCEQEAILSLASRKSWWERFYRRLRDSARRYRGTRRSGRVLRRVDATTLVDQSDQADDADDRDEKRPTGTARGHQPEGRSPTMFKTMMSARTMTAVSIALLRSDTAGTQDVDERNLVTAVAQSVDDVLMSKPVFAGSSTLRPSTGGLTPDQITVRA